jgi:hypothetical protein
MSDQPYFAPLTGKTGALEREMSRQATAEASHQEQDHFQSLGQPRRAQPALPQLKEPVLSDEHEQQVAALDEKIMSHGIAIDSDALVALGKKKFDELLVIARESGLWGARGASIDLSRFESVQKALGAFQAPAVPVRKTREQIAESGREKDEVRRIAGWQDLWKFASQEPTFVNSAYDFHDHFASLALGQSLVERTSSDGRLRSRWLCGGRGAKVARLTDWLTRVARDSLTSVKLVEPLWSLVSWLADERAPAPAAADLAKDFFSCRAPAREQIAIAQSVLDAFLLDFDAWRSWEYIGRRSRSSIEKSRLDAWRMALSKRFARIDQWHASVRAAFVREVDMGDAAPREQKFESAQSRAFIDRTVQSLLALTSKLLALGVAEVAHDAIVARFESGVLLEAKHKQPADKRATISRQLLAAFPASSFELEFAEVRA